MAGELDLAALLSGMRPRLDPDLYMFALLPHGRTPPAGLLPLMSFREREGTTLILLRDEALRHGLEATFVCRRITLEIHSSLEAVGFLAAITRRLAEAGMGVNPVAAYHHDHLFIAADRADEAMRILEDLASRTK